MAGEGGGDVRADLEAPIRALPVRSGQVGRDRPADEIVELGVGEDRACAADKRVDGETMATNLPGTDRERSNWRLKVGPDVEEAFAGVRARAILAALAKGRS